MKKYYLLFCSLVLSCLALAQRNITGTWAGKLATPGGSLRIVVHIQEKTNGYTATLDSPDQGATGIRFSSVLLNGDSIHLELPVANARYSGTLTSDTTIRGQWIQGTSFPLDLEKATAADTVAKPKRPQTPVPPFPYLSTDVLYQNKDKSITYGGTVTRPAGSGPFPALLLLTGSGPQNRDEEIFGHRPFAVIADYLTKRGYLVLRTDDRGVGQTTGDRTTATSHDFAIDAMAGLNYLQSLPEVDQTKIGLLGHSEGGMVAQIVAAQRKDVDFLILLAAPGEKIIDLMTDQNKAILASMGLPAPVAQHYLELYKPLVTAIAYAASDTAAYTAATNLVSEWVKKTPADVVAATTGIRNDESKEQFINRFVRETGSPWFRYFIRYNPAPLLQKIGAKVLALNGDKDIQVLSSTNLPALKSALQKSGAKTVTAVEMKGLNHLFQHCQKCTIAEYAELEETIAPEVLESIGNWLDAHVK